MKIGILSKNFAAQRLFLDKIGGAIYKDVRFYNLCLWKNAHLWALKFLHLLKLSPEEEAAKLFCDFKAAIPTGCDLYHFFNCINHSSSSKWVISVESGVPWPVSVTRCVESVNADLSSIVNDVYVCDRIRMLAKPNCLGLLALSNCTNNIQREIIRQFPEYEKAIERKLITLHPAQQLFINDIKEKGLTWSDDEKFTFIYVGKDFYRKGGRESVQVLSKLHGQYDFKLILISRMTTDESRYMLSDHDEEDAHRLIAENRDWIEYYPGLPNEEVLEKLKSAHVCLLPTWMDTYAYSVLESQACGTPLITTSIRALSEINNPNVGWLVDVPVNKLNNPLHLTKAQRIDFEKQLVNNLEQKVRYVLSHREEVKEKSRLCLERIAKFHNPEEYAKKMGLIYDGKISMLCNNENK